MLKGTHIPSQIYYCLYSVFLQRVMKSKSQTLANLLHGLVVAHNCPENLLKFFISPDLQKTRQQGRAQPKFLVAITDQNREFGIAAIVHLDQSADRNNF